MNAKSFAFRAIGILILVFVGGWFVGGILNTAAIVSPPLVSMVQCPAGSMSAQQFKQQSFDQPGQKTLTFSCVDQNGASVTPLSDAQSRAIEYRIFYPAGVVLTALIVGIWLLGRAMRRQTAARAGSAA